ncbi:hypothetical protein TWF481_003790 [Arthrobotrys musiformis]|uniref:F-box domain-containing protein n=1 Tax=Arthrobotrys musiformis TaxID=47236 RepID=A0AAV9WIW5_9PEZI
MAPNLLTIPEELQYKILSQVLDISVDFVFKSPYLVREWRNKASPKDWDKETPFRPDPKDYPSGEVPDFKERPYFLNVRVVPTRIPPALKLVSREFSKVVEKVAVSMDKLAPAVESEINKEISVKGLPPRGWQQWEQAFCRFQHRESPGRIIIAGYPRGFMDCVALLASQESTRSLYFTHPITDWATPGFDEIWKFIRPTRRPPDPFNIHSDAISTAFFFNDYFPYLETIAIGVTDLVQHDADSKLPLSQGLRWLALESPHCSNRHRSNRRPNPSVPRLPKARRLELTFDKEGKRIEGFLNLDDYYPAPTGCIWVTKRLTDQEVSKRGRYYTDWDHTYFGKDDPNFRFEEEGDVLQVEMKRVGGRHCWCWD